MRYAACSRGRCGTWNCSLTDKKTGQSIVFLKYLILWFSMVERVHCAALLNRRGELFG
jgi:hypothetical protein